MGFLLWIVFGLIAGLAAEWLLPGLSPGGIIVTVSLGIAGAVVGGMAGTAFGVATMSGFDVRSLMIAICGALILLMGYPLVASKKSA